MTALATLLHLLLLAAPSQSTYDAEIALAVLDVERIHYVPPALVTAIIRCESDFNPLAFSRAGAIGLMQLMPRTAARVGLMAQDLWDPAKNILAGTRFLAILLRYYRGDLISALVAYNARPRELFAPIPRNGETPRYVAAVLQAFDEYSDHDVRGGRTPSRPGHGQRSPFRKSFHSHPPGLYP
jgi:soluble lytic murein transglycosylase-like protein